MVKYFVKVGSSISALALVASSFVGPVAAINVNVQGNGADSNSTVDLNLASNTTVNQTNNATINNTFNVEVATGENKAEKNTGGDTTITTGDATANVTANNKANANQANVDNCVCGQDVNVTVKGNGAKSDNDVTVDLNNTVNIRQDNQARINNNINIDADTGDNKAQKNTGGDVSIDTGNADATVTVNNTANLNGAVVAGKSGTGGVLSVVIDGNGAGSDNNVEVDSTNNTTVNQRNKADFDNNVNINGETGDNTAEDNTGGNSSITTGDATANVGVNNTANFNWADVNVCCFDDAESSITVKGNGADSDNDVTLDFLTKQKVVQDNNAYFDNGGGKNDGLDLDTGDNKVKGNTQGGDPSIDTGNAGADVTVNNTANQNALNGDLLDLPDFPSGDSWAVLVWLFGHLG